MKRFLLQPFLALALLNTVLCQTQSLRVGVVDNKRSEYVSQASEGAQFSLTSDGAACVQASLLGLPCPFNTVDASAQAENILQFNVFSAPKAVVSLKVAGKLSGFQGMAGDRMIRQEDLVAGTSALQLSASLRAVSKSAQRLSNAYQADYAALPGCSDTCMEGLVEEAVMAIGGNYTAGAGGSMRGVARVWQTEGLHAAAVELDLRQLPVRLWAAEIAVLRYTAAEMATEQTRREKQKVQQMGGPWLLEGTVVGLQALSQAGQVSTVQYAGAELAFKAAFSQALDILSVAFNDRVVCQIILLAEVPTPSIGLPALLQWRSASLARLPQSLSALGGTLPSGGRNSLNWQTDAAAWLSFIVIAVFLAAAVWFLTNMQFKKDSLLYGRAKAD